MVKKVEGRGRDREGVRELVGRYEMYITAASQRSSRVFTYSLPFFLPTPTAPGAVTMQSAVT